jgi:large subunit ribosomal protein L14e
MSGLGVGRVCIKTAGRKAGEKVVVLEIEKQGSFAIVAGPSVKKKRCNLRHLLPLERVVKVGKSISQKELAKILEE